MDILSAPYRSTTLQTPFRIAMFSDGDANVFEGLGHIFRSVQYNLSTYVQCCLSGKPRCLQRRRCFESLTAQAKSAPETLEGCFQRGIPWRGAFGIIPLKSTLAGTIHRSYDLLFEHELKIVGETIRRIQHALIAIPACRWKTFVRPVTPRCLPVRAFLPEHPDDRANLRLRHRGGSRKHRAQRPPETRLPLPAGERRRFTSGAILADSHPGSRRELHALSSRLLPPSRPNRNPCHRNTGRRLSSAWLTFPARCTNLCGLSPKRGVDLSKIESRPLHRISIRVSLLPGYSGKADSESVQEAWRDLNSQGTVRARLRQLSAF